MRIGIISDIHQHPHNIAIALEYFLAERVDLLVGAGDISNSHKSLQQVVGTVASVGIPTVLFPGSHEKLMVWQNVFQEVPNHIVDGLQHRKLPLDGFDLVIVPGSESLAGGDITLVDNGNSRVERGRYLSSINDLEMLVTNPSKTVIACHNPPLFRTDRAVDYAFFGEKNTEILPGYDATYYNLILNDGEKFSTQRENRGSQPFTTKIASVFPQKDEKVITAHFHESTHKAIDREERPVAEGTWTRNLYHCASNLDFYRIGIWETRIQSGVLEVRYKNVDLGKFL